MSVVLVSVVLASLLFGMASVLLPFELNGEPALAVVLAVVLVRGFSEALFFEGFLHRTLLVELPSGAVAHIISMAAYVVYMNTYRFLWDPQEPHHAGALLYGLLVALPAGFVYYRTRSWPMAALIRCGSLLGTALAACRVAGVV